MFKIAITPCKVRICEDDENHNTNKKLQVWIQYKLNEKESKVFLDES